MENKDYIDELIMKNLGELNDNEPKEGHFERFEAKLNAQNKKGRKITFSAVWKVAAAIIFVFLATNQAFIYFSNDNSGIIPAQNNGSGVSLASLSSEYEEVEFYYTNAINTGLNQWNTLNTEGFISAEEQEVMDEELQEFETLYKNLQQDLEANPNDERVINAMLEFYQAKLSVINMIVTKLEEVKQQKNTSYERDI